MSGGTLDERWAALTECYAEQARACASRTPDLALLESLSKRCAALLAQLVGPDAPQPENAQQSERVVQLAQIARAHLESSKATIQALRTELMRRRAASETNAHAVRAYLGMPRKTVARYLDKRH